MKTKKIFQIVVGVLSVAGMAPQAYAITGCTTNTLTGPYGLQFSGMVTPALAGGVAGTVTPASLLQQITSDPPAVGYAQVFLDGGGNLFGNSAVNLNGMWSEGPVSGTYTVTSDCQVSFLITDSSGGTQHFNGIVVSQGEAGVLLQTDPGVGVSGALKRAKGACQLSDLAGTFVLRTSGTILASGETSSIGIIALDGQGGASAVESTFTGGAQGQVASNGTFSINPDCTVTASLGSAIDGSIANYRGVIVNGLKEVLLIRSDTGTVVTANLMAQ